MDLLAVADFNLVARHGGFGKAARATGRPKATLSRRVAELEASLDLRLFERGARALKLTEEGRALFERAGRLLSELEETAAAIASGGERPRGRLRVSAPLVFSQVAMGKIAAGFAMSMASIWGFLESFALVGHLNAYLIVVAWALGQALGAASNRLTHGTWGACW